MKSSDVNNMKSEHVRKYLIKLIEALDNIEKEDFFGTEGWRRYIMGEDD